MIVEKLELCNFMGYEGSHSITFPKAGILLGKNGTGKTTVLNAVRYALTGDKPQGDIINSNADSCSVTLTLKNGDDCLIVTREENRDKANNCYMAGKKVSQKALNEWIENFIHLPADKISIISSAEVAAALSGADMSRFLLSYIPQKTSRDDVIKMLGSDVTEGEKKIITESLPEEVSIDSLDEFDFFLRDTRKPLKKQVSFEKEMADLKIPDRPAETKEEISKQLEDLKKTDTSYAVYLLKVSAYEKAEASIKIAEQKKADLKKQIDSISADEPDMNVKASIQKEFSDIQSTENNNKVAFSSMKEGRQQLAETLDALNKPICPISPLITCHENKTVAKSEIEASIRKMDEGMEALKAEVLKADARKKELVASAQKWQDNKNLWDKKASLMTELKALEEAPSALPEKPEKMEKPNTTTEEARLKGLLNAIELNDQREKDLEALKTDSEYLADIEALIKAVSDKGVIRGSIVKSFLKVFEEECNAKCKGTVYAFRFIYDKGVVPEMRNSHGVYLRYTELSGGEKAFFMYVIIALLNSLTGARILLLDELSVMDSDVFAQFLEMIKAHEDDFDTVILSAVDHPDTIKAAEDSGIAVITVEEGKGTGSGEGDDADSFMSIPSGAEDEEMFVI